MAALAALYPAKLQKVAAFDRFGHYRLETGEQLLVWTPIYPACLLYTSDAADE